MDEGGILAIMFILGLPIATYHMGKAVEGSETIRDCREFGKREASDGKWIDCSIRKAAPSEGKQ